jgi:hypothetical protein
VRYWDAPPVWLPSNDVLPDTVPRFYLVPIAPAAREEQALNEEYEDPVLAAEIEQMREDLQRILDGDDPDNWRYRNFMMGGKKRALLAQAVMPGPLTQSEFYYVVCF